MTTNFFDLTWQHNHSMSSLLAANPGQPTPSQGGSARLPCMTWGSQDFSAFEVTRVYTGRSVVGHMH